MCGVQFIVEMLFVSVDFLFGAREIHSGEMAGQWAEKW